MKLVSHNCFQQIVFAVQIWPIHKQVMITVGLLSYCTYWSAWRAHAGNFSREDLRERFHSGRSCDCNSATPYDLISDSIRRRPVLAQLAVALWNFFKFFCYHNQSHGEVPCSGVLMNSWYGDLKLLNLCFQFIDLCIMVCWNLRFPENEMRKIVVLQNPCLLFGFNMVFTSVNLLQITTTNQELVRNCYNMICRR